MQLRWQSARLACERYGDRYPASPLFLCFLIFLVHPFGPKMKKFTSPLMVQLKIFKWAWAFNQFQCKPVLNSPSFMLCPHFNNHAHNFFPLKLLGIPYYLLFIINSKQTKTKTKQKNYTQLHIFERDAWYLAYNNFISL